jgi:hypothetical protein
VYSFQNKKPEIEQTVYEDPDSPINKEPEVSQYVVKEQKKEREE